MLPFYPFYWADYSSKTFDLTMEQHGAYMLYLRHIYTTGEGIPHKQRFSIARAMTEQSQSDATIVLEKFFFLDDGLWRNLRAEEIILTQEDVHSKRVAAGKKGGKAKAKAGSKPGSSKAKAKLKQSSSNQNQNQNHIFGIDKSIPHYVDKGLWDSFMAVRAKKKAACTDNALDLVLKTLAKVHNSGGNANEVIEKSIMNGWTGVFPDKVNPKGNNYKNTNFEDQNYDRGTEGFDVE
jgi:uncharacterized protein YdaU (DUF1376 family)